MQAAQVPRKFSAGLVAKRAAMTMHSLSRRAFSATLMGTGAALGLPPIAGAQTLIPVKGAITSVYYDAVPILWAQKSGMFAKAGIDIDLGRLPTGAAVTTAVAGGSLNRQVDVLCGRGRVCARRADRRHRPGRHL
jgi:hypothetical protein